MSGNFSLCAPKEIIRVFVLVRASSLFSHCCTLKGPSSLYPNCVQVRWLAVNFIGIFRVVLATFYSLNSFSRFLILILFLNVSSDVIFNGCSRENVSAT